MNWADRVRTACITVLGSGFAPFASGSWGSLVAVVLYVGAFCAWARLAPAHGLEWFTWAGIAGAALLSVLWGDWAIRRFGSKDPKPFVLDEFAGQWVALLYLPHLHRDSPLLTWGAVLAGQFFLFRLFDVLKPAPARQLERLPAGWGILLDDLFAGLYANLAGQLVWRFTPVAAWLTLPEALA